jgi:hypothetical protein
MERGKAYRGVVWEKAVGNITCIGEYREAWTAELGLSGGVYCCVGVCIGAVCTLKSKFALPAQECFAMIITL